MIRIEVETLGSDKEGVLVKIRRIPLNGKPTVTLVRVRPGDNLWSVALQTVRRLQGKQAEA